MNAPSFPELSQRLGKLDPNAKARWGKMNLAQMLVHCRIPMETGLGLREVEKPSANFATRWLLFPLLMKLPWPNRDRQHPGTMPWTFPHSGPVAPDNLTAV